MALLSLRAINLYSMIPGHHSIGSIALKRENSHYQAAFCILKENDTSLLQYIGLLHPAERQYYHGLKADARKASYLLGRVTAKLAIAHLLPVPDPSTLFIDFGVFHFPVVKNTGNHNVQVSISHCDEAGIAIAFPEEHPLGIDIEKTTPDKIADISPYISAKEQALIATLNLPVHVGYTLLWTMKESLSKVLKTGLTVAFHLLEIDTLIPTGTTYTATFTHFGQYQAIACYWDHYVCAVTVPGRTTATLDTLFQSLTRTC